ncbi:sensor histidine kinase [Saccharibacillus sp. CPCC 101409]|uniref:cache domain-containing sensor histidine kinase n=1 Tax=Saccharibacillus sp. CPCC 101409 TaxID=3058041 RepID=UPI0026740A5E|nr:sensor histidine kinase [Saccharibacillus sp. CPCC 101409]MDO3413281.1 sensor histidine kinase [Saccharibacillus sp. CPCC 101409]
MRIGYGKLFGAFGLRRKALIIFLLFVILPTFGVGVVAQYQFNQILRAQFINSTSRNIDNVTAQLSEQTQMIEDIANYMILSPDMRSFLRPSPPLTDDQRTNLKRNIEGFLTFQLISRSYIRSIEISGYNGSEISMGEPFSGDESLWRRRADSRKGGITWTEGYSLHSGWNGEVRLVSMFRVLNSYNEITRPLGRLIIRRDEASIVNLLDKGIFENGKGRVYLIGKQGEVVLGSKSGTDEAANPEADAAAFKPDDELLKRLDSGRQGFFTRPFGGDSGGERYLTLYTPVENTGWSMVALIPETTVDEEFRGVKLLMLTILVAILLLGLSALIGFHYTIITPILRLKKEAGRVAVGDFSARVPIKSRDELADLNRTFNKMVSTIQQLIEQKYKLELRERESELKLLQSQMDPHFLYNTLDTIRWTARLEKAEESSRLIEMLSKFFRASVGGGSSTTTLKREMEFVQSYLFLQQRRLGDALSYSLRIEPGLEEAVVLKTTIQPLVENFIKHGLDRRTRQGEVRVDARSADGGIVVDVIDNGRGMTPQRKREVEALLQSRFRDETRQGAVSNIHERIMLLFGPEYGLEIVRTSPQGTWIRMRVPLGDYPQEGGRRREYG